MAREFDPFGRRDRDVDDDAVPAGDTDRAGGVPTDGGAATAGRVRMSVRARLTLLLMMGIPTVGCDQVTKAAAVRHLADGPPVELLDGAVLFHYAENPGVLFSIGSGLPDDLRFLLFTVVMGSLLVLTGVAFLRVRHLGRVGLVGLALALSGGLGNLVDRLAYGHVIDFISVGVGGVHTAIWNLADAAILVGLLVFALAGQLREVPVDS